MDNRLQGLQSIKSLSCAQLCSTEDRKPDKMIILYNLSSNGIRHPFAVTDSSHSQPIFAMVLNVS